MRILADGTIFVPDHLHPEARLMQRVAECVVMRNLGPVEKLVHERLRTEPTLYEVPSLEHFKELAQKIFDLIDRTEVGVMCHMTYTLGISGGLPHGVPAFRVEALSDVGREVLQIACEVEDGKIVEMGPCLFVCPFEVLN